MKARSVARIEPPLESTQKLIDKLVELTQRYGDQPPVIWDETMGRRLVIRRVAVCSNADHIVLEVIPE